ncbi:MAG: indolepyruvate ferredoxin oxidoreductase subunit alpha [Eubacteriales bacterium]|nr:indolepyruvate ferredoxin oxidoreductase subunit alpha [Eubacteriales bacterium]
MSQPVMTEKQILLGNEAIARGAYEAGVKVVSSYPGTPSTEITENAAKYPRIATEWATNEKVGLEVSYGASLGGGRAMSCMKHVGLNVAADPLFTASYTGVNGGLVVVVADDPGMHSSQNEQDSRHYARSAKLMMFEPSDSQECLDMTRAAFALSEKYDTPVMLRVTTRVAHSRTPVSVGEPQDQVIKPYVKDTMKFVMMPGMAIKRHVVVEQRQAQVANDADQGMIPNAFSVKTGDGQLGIITSGMAYQYVRGALPQAAIFKLGLVYPLPLAQIRAFAQTVERLVIVEELDPFLETEIKAAGIVCEGKALLTLQGEYSVARLKAALAEATILAPAFDLASLEPAPARPPVMCAGCPHKGLFMALSRLKVIVAGDIGCYTLGALAPTHAMDVCLCMGASVGMAHGIDKVSDTEMSRKTVAVIGDSTFLHTGISSLINSVYNRSTSTLIILDNSITGMTGHQQNAASGLNIHNQGAPELDLVALVRAIGVTAIHEVDPADIRACQRVIKQAIDEPMVSVVIAKRPCALIPSGIGDKDHVVHLDKDLCTRCMACIKIMCPALQKGPDGYPHVDPNICNSCHLCTRVCGFGALKAGGEAI